MKACARPGCRKSERLAIFPLNEMIEPACDFCNGSAAPIWPCSRQVRLCPSTGLLDDFVVDRQQCQWNGKTGSSDFGARIAASAPTRALDGARRLFLCLGHKGRNVIYE